MLTRGEFGSFQMKDGKTYKQLIKIKRNIDVGFGRKEDKSRGAERRGESVCMCVCVCYVCVCVCVRERERERAHSK